MDGLERERSLRSDNTTNMLCCVIPEWTSDGLLPPGVHVAPWPEVIDRFGWTAWRRSLLTGLQSVTDHLGAVGCSRVWLDGSFVTTKERPGDFDIVWDMEGADLKAIDPVLRHLAPPRVAQHAKYGGDILPNVIEGGSGMPFVDFFQQDEETGDPKGIVELWLRREAP